MRLVFVCTSILAYSQFYVKLLPKNYIIYIDFIKFKIDFFCAPVNVFHTLINSFCSSVNAISSSSFNRKSITVISKAEQTASNNDNVAMITYLANYK